MMSVCPSLRRAIVSARRVTKAGTVKPNRLDAVSVVGLGDLGFHQQFDIVAANDGRNELDRSAEGFEDDRGVERLRDYDRNLAAREKFGLLTGVGQQMRLGKDFAEVVCSREIGRIPATNTFEFCAARP